MNYSTAVFLINDNCRAIEAIYEPDAPGAKTAPRAIFKTFDQSVKVDDLLIVPSHTRHNVTTVKVTAVDLDLDPATTADIKWIIGVIDVSHFEEMKAVEAAAIAKIKASERTHARNELRAKMFAHVNQEELQTLSLAKISGS